jgi:hypothetical protein
VSFSAVKFKEGPAPPIVTGDWDAGRGPEDPALGPHKEGGWLPILRPGEGRHPNKVWGDDWISSGGKTRTTGAASGYTWRIPWLYQWMGAETVFFTMLHTAVDDGSGGMTLSKGGVTVSTNAATAPQWYFTPEQDSERIKGFREDEWDPQYAVWFKEFPFAAAGVHSLIREGQAGERALLDLIEDEAKWWPGAPERLHALGIT